VVNAAELQAFYSRLGVSSSFQMADENYSCPSLNWVEEIFAPSLSSLLSQLSADIWTPEDFDCDDFARMAAAYAGLLHHLTVGREKDTALAFGEFWYVRDIGGGHAINTTVVSGKNNEATAIFFEPQNSSIVNLSRTEIESCLGLRF
jgi:hypothetical protein